MKVRRNQPAASPRFPRGLALLLLAGTLLLAYGVLHQRIESVAPIAAADVITAEAPPQEEGRAYLPPRRFSHSAPPESRWAGLVATADAETDLNTRQELLEKLAAEVSPADIPAALDELKNAGFGGHEFTRRLLRRWAQADAPAASTWAGQLPAGAERESALSAVAIAWANTDLDSAAAWAQQLPDQAERQTALLAIANEAVRAEPMEALRLAVELPANSERDDAIRRAVMEWAAADATSAVDWAKQIPDEALRSKVLAAEAVAWSESAPESAATLAVENLPAGRLLDNTVVSIVQRWAQQQPEAAAAWVAEFPAGELKVAATDNLLAIVNLHDQPADETSRSDPDPVN